MPLRIRLAMHGLRHQRIFHLVVINQKARRDGKPVELLGVYDPHLNYNQTHKTVEWSVDRIKYWLSVGAQPSKSAVKLLELGNILKPDSAYHRKDLPPRSVVAVGVKDQKQAMERIFSAINQPLELTNTPTPSQNAQQ